MRTSLFLSCLAVMILAGCAGTIAPVKTDPPAAFIFVPENLDLVDGAACPAGRTVESRRSLRRPIAACHAESAFAQGFNSAETASALSSQRRNGVENFQLPKGKYMLNGEDRGGYYYQAPGGINAGQMRPVPGGIYWRKSSDRPIDIYLDYKRNSHPAIILMEELADEVVIPPKVMTPEWRSFVGDPSESGQ